MSERMRITNARTICALVYGAIVAAAGIWRFIAAESHNALWFGVVMGAAAAAGAVLMMAGKRAAGAAAVWVSLLFVGGFFIVKASKGIEDDSWVRVGIILAATAVTAAVMVRGVFNSRKEIHAHPAVGNEDDESA